MAESVCTLYGWTTKDLAKVLDCQDITVRRWVDGTYDPVGIYKAVLNALHAAAQHMGPEERAGWGRRLVIQGIGGLLYAELAKV